jgi:D-sedoheptulose 7-phosphate isomerase
MNEIDRIFTMDAAGFAASYIEHHCKVMRRIKVEEIAAFIAALLDARERGATIFFVGNGGSAATASHFANDLAIGTESYKKPFRALSLCDNQAVITAVANDTSYDEIFERQLMVLAKAGDVLVGISASGNSPNLVRAFQYALEHDIGTIAITAFDGGKMKQMAVSGVHVPTEPKEYGPAEDGHMMLDHLVGAYLMRAVKSVTQSKNPVKNYAAG